MAQVNKDSFTIKHARGDYDAEINDVITKINLLFTEQRTYLVGLHAMARVMAILLGPAKPKTRANWVRDLPVLLRGNIAMIDKVYGRQRPKSEPGVVHDLDFMPTTEENLQITELLEPMSEAMTGHPRLISLLALSRMMSAVLAEAPAEVAEHACRLIPDTIASFMVALDHAVAEVRAEQQQSTNH